MMQAEYVIKALKGKWYGHYGNAFCPCHDNRITPALSLSHDKNTDKLLVYCHAGCNPTDILKILNTRGFLKNFRYSRSSHFQPRNNSFTGQDTFQFIAKILQECSPIEGTIAEQYLRQARNIYCPLSDSLKYHPNLYHSPTKQSFPALIGIVTDFTSFDIKAIHRTYLNQLGSKADIEQNKMMLGKVCGGGVVLSRSDKIVLIVAEGIETALSLKEFYPDTNIVATLSTAGMKGFILPEPAGKLIVGIDNDIAGIKAGNLLAERAYGSGWEVKVMTPPKNQDWNDVLVKHHSSKEII